MKDNVNYAELLKNLGRSIWRSISNNFWYKLLSIVIAVFLWSYVITSNPSIPREKVFSGMDVLLSGQTALANRNLALLTDVTSESPTATVRISVPQSSYNSVTEGNVRVELDLSTVRKPGKQMVRLRPSTVYGVVAQITPESIEVEVEEIDQRVMTVNVQWNGEKSDQYWYNTARINPSVITVSGPQSLVQRASSAVAMLDVNGSTEPGNRVESVVILDAQGQELPSMLVKSTSSVSISLDIYPKKQLPVSTDMSEVLTGELPTGYKIDGEIEVQPSTIEVAAEQALLDSLTSVSIAPVDISGATRSFNRTTSVNKLADVKNYSSENVNVKVDIVEIDFEKTFSNVAATLINLDPQFKAKWSAPKLMVKVTGPATVIQGLAKGDLVATVDLSEIDAPGSHDLPIRVSVDNYPELGFEVSPDVARVSISEN